MGSVRHEDLLVVERFLGSSTPHREVFTRLRPQIVTSHDLDQRLWASQLAHGFNNTLGLTAVFLVGPIHGLW
jgi:hypothetical protein